MGRLGVVVSPVHPIPDALVLFIDKHSVISEIVGAGEVALVPPAFTFHMEVTADLVVAAIRGTDD